MQRAVESFFSRFEQANSSSDTKALAELYADSFLFGGPNGEQVVRRDSLLQILPRMKAHYAAMGLVDRKLTNIEMQQLDAKYLLAKVGWTMGIDHPTGKFQVDISATYILVEQASGELLIVFQIDHQDLAATLKSSRVPHSYAASSRMSGHVSPSTQDPTLL